MAPQAPVAELRDALYELARYLSDEVAPMMVYDSVELLMEQPPKLVATEIKSWVASQYKGAGASIPVSDYLFHAVKKIHLLTEYDLIDEKRTKAFLGRLVPFVLQLCPEEDRELLRKNLERIGHAERPASSASAEFIHRQAGTGPVRSGTRGTEDGEQDAGAVARGLKRFSLIVEQLGRIASGALPAAAEHAEARSHAVTAAALSAQSNSEFDDYIHRLSRLGVDAGSEQVFQTLAHGLPGWAVAPTLGGADGEAPLVPSRSVEAMERLIDIAEDPAEGAQRFNDLVMAAIQRFNEGALPQAVTMIDLAERISREKKVERHVVTSIRARAHESLDDDRLREVADAPDKLILLRRILRFFPALAPEGLLADLQDEPRRERRRLLLLLVRAHGEAARPVVMAKLKGAASGGLADPDGYVFRNLVYLLRRLPRVEGAPLDEELAVLASMSTLDNPPLVVREAVLTLGQIRDARSEQILITRLQELEKLAANGPASEEIVDGMERVVTSLAQLRMPNAARAVVFHALVKNPAFGNAMARLQRLAGQDLSGDDELIGYLVRAVRQELPRKVLGLVVSRKNENIHHLLTALATSPHEQVRLLFEEIGRHYPGRDFADEAAEILKSFDAPDAEAAAQKAGRPASKTLTGDLELFGLASLLQTLADSQMTGELTLEDAEGHSFATFAFDAGKVLDCQTGTLSGRTAFYQLFEKPEPGTFVFAGKDEPTAIVSDDEPFDVMGTMLEAMRRYDEFQQARTLVPDDARLKPGERPPTPPRGEKDHEFCRAVWARASAGESPSDCEGAIAVDAYSIRRLYAYWVETGALVADAAR